MEGSQQADPPASAPVVRRAWLERTPPVLLGFDLALFIPLVLFAPSLVSGHLARAIDDGQAYNLLPAFAVSILPAAALGYWIGWRTHQGRALFQASIGAFLAGWIGGSLALWLSFSHLAPAQRLLLSFAGGPALLGFWIWFGVLVGGAMALRFVAAADN